MHHVFVTEEGYVENSSPNGGMSIREIRVPKETIDEAVTLLKSLGYQVPTSDG
jgi:hypothetical protein